MPDTKHLLPDLGNVDQLGSIDQPWQKIFAKAIFIDGKKLFFIPINAGDIVGGELDPSLIRQLLNSVQVLQPPSAPITLAQIVTAAMLGAQDPAARINADASQVLDGKAVLFGTLDPQTIVSTGLKPFVSLIYIDQTTGGIQSTNYIGGSAGFTIRPWVIECNVPLLVNNYLNIGGRFVINPVGNATIGDQSSANGLVLRIDNTGQITAGGKYGNLDPSIAKLNILATGDIIYGYLGHTPASIDINAIDVNVDVVYFSQQAGNLVLTTATTSALMYYTADGSDPTNFANVNRIKYTAPFAAVNGTTYKACAQKLGTCGFITQHTQVANMVDNPLFNPAPGPYSTVPGYQDVVITIDTPGATIKYTLDGTDPSISNGTVYVGALRFIVGSHHLKAIGLKAGMTNSDIVEGFYAILT